MGTPDCISGVPVLIDIPKSHIPKLPTYIDYLLYETICLIQFHDHVTNCNRKDIVLGMNIVLDSMWLYTCIYKYKLRLSLQYVHYHHPYENNMSDSHFMCTLHVKVFSVRDLSGKPEVCVQMKNFIFQNPDEVEMILIA